MLFEVFDLRPILVGEAIACGVGNVDHSGSGLDDSFDDFSEVLIVGASGILSIELNVIDILLGISYGPYGTLEDLLTGGVELIFNMIVARADTRMDAFMFGILQSLSGAVNVFFHGACQCADSRPSHGFGDLHHRVEVTRR